ncbi:MAG TPA: hypothetical protein VF756_29435 [Thermoanaerobaculia bacterium]
MAADPVIRRGIDTFTTTDNGKTYYDFAQTPIPAGFFCARSAAFTGRIAFKGLPLETEVPGQLRGADTVIERLDDAVFAANNTAVTRIRFRALSLVSIAPLRTACGAFHVYVSLADRQRVTRMRIRRTQENGGTFVAPLAVNVRLTFIPVKPAKKGARRLELTGDFTFPGKPIPWSSTAGARTKGISSAVVDTNGDLAPDALLSGTSNFFPGWSPDGVMTKYGGGSCSICEPETCHTDPSTGKEHCSGPVYACYPYHCP